MRKVYYWTEARKSIARFVLLTARNYTEAVLKLKNYGIETNSGCLQVLACNEKIYRPVITANHGGKRR